MEILFVINKDLLFKLFNHIYEYFEGPFWIMLFLEPFLLFMLASVYYFMFKVNVLNTYGIKFKKQTNILSLLYTSSLFAYFTFPMVLNFYNIFLNKDNTSFELTFG